MTLNGLNPAHVAAHSPTIKARHDTATARVATWLDHPGPTGYVAWSGGRDSTVVAHMANQAHPGVPIVWFNSGLEFPDTAPYIDQIAHEHHFNLHVIDATPDALTIMRTAGTWNHDTNTAWDVPDLHTALITVPARTARDRYGAHELWGMRAEESQARQALLRPGRGEFTRTDGTRTLAPIWSWTALDVDAYLARHQIREHPAYGLLRAAGASGKDLRVGLAVDGNNLAHGRVVWLRRIYPDLYAQIEQALPRVREWT